MIAPGTTALSPDPRQEDLDFVAPYGPLRRSGARALPSPRYPRFSPCGLPKRVIPLRGSPLRRRSLRPYPDAIEAPDRGLQQAKGDSHDYRQFHLQRSPGYLHGRACDPLGRGPQGSVPAERGEDRQGSEPPRRRQDRRHRARRRVEEAAPRRAGITSRSSSTIRHWQRRSTAPWWSQTTTRKRIFWSGRATAARRRRSNSSGRGGSQGPPHSRA